MLLAFALILCLSASFLVLIFLSCYRRSAIAEAFGNTYLPAMLLCAYGLFALPRMMGLAPPFGSGLDPSLYVLGLLLAVLAGVGHIVGFNLPRALAPRRSRSVPPVDAKHDTALMMTFLVFTFIDLAVRVYELQAGLYFSWMIRASLALQEAELSPLQMLQNGVMPLLLVLAVHFSRRYPALYYYIVLLGLAVVLEGSRGNLIYFVMVLVLALWCQGRFKLNVFRPLYILGGVMLYFGMSVILEMRRYLRVDERGALENPLSFVVEVFPKAVGSALGVVDRQAISSINMQGAELLDRLSAWSDVFSMQLNSLNLGADFLGIESLFLEMSIVVPGILWLGDKPAVDSGNILLNHFGMTDVIRADPATSVYSSMYLHTGLMGLLLFAFLIGLCHRVILFLGRYQFGRAGDFLYIGLLAFYAFRGNSFAVAISGFRNGLLLLFVFIAVKRLWSASGDRRGFRCRSHPVPNPRPVIRQLRTRFAYSSSDQRSSTVLWRSAFLLRRQRRGVDEERKHGF